MDLPADAGALLGELSIHIGNSDEDPMAMLEKYVERHAGELRKLTLEALRSVQ
jgi:hypothetical protein